MSVEKYVREEVEQVTDEQARSILQAAWKSKGERVGDVLTPRAVYLLARYINRLEKSVDNAQKYVSIEDRRTE